MATTTAQTEQKTTPPARPARRTPSTQPAAAGVARPARRISLEQFLLKYSDREDGYKYEWNNGRIEKSKAMNQQQSKFFYILLSFFLKTEAARKGGLLIAETDMQTTREQYRRPDIAFYNAEQLSSMWSGQNQIAPWVVEIISPTDNADKINQKLEEYFRAGVQVVWHIFPASQKVDVFTSPDDVKICRGKVVCSAAPAVPDLEIAAETLFA